ncbi:endonuclease V-like isoform X1 [Scophthalmus maximus]|uniref:endonuclease V-like isoform X1 n=2 Tax=Scophthalmus maximus TaxID=52904 RepID=UPI001FA8354B|nr:endonuclease V-like isoform X1 [Scophthalmus maximus]XP_035493285.2 endonuclease V-like isoform X1 [Scophthalmus maximus]XP_035493286.2 endonuclease V-like isoform X1 [Scophthalmus maximus]XP_047189900.1 endonuclease V-like isoform X1 [Scophthalmus maximus]XP_047189901.1 endonuclease V-like isoform X1 [Scophthalmus maximus]XP_047189902.1 endonuclease V-like isoform X1 [Scophthalmus maximus]
MPDTPAEDLVKQWESVQARLRQQLVEEDTEDWQTRPGFLGLQRVGGVDLSFIKGDDVNACAQLVVLSYPGLEMLYEDSQMVTLTAPYIAGFLAFRETPFLLEALQRLQRDQPALLPQVVFVDGNGLFHYREFGLACHLGVLSGLPCVGVAKNLLQVQGVYKNEEHQSQKFGTQLRLDMQHTQGLPSGNSLQQIAALQKGGDSFPLTAASGKVLGKALRSSDRSSKPVYVSVGHKISLDTAVRLTHSCCRYRVPEPIRQADCRSREYLRVRFPAADIGSKQ